MGFSADQLVARRKGIGGSDAPSIFGCGYLSPLELYFRKRGDIDDTSEQNEAMFWGAVLEEPIADEWAKRHNKKIRRVPSMKWSTAYPHMFVSVDRHIMGDPRGPGVLEVKNFHEFKGRTLDEHDFDTVPLHVRIQAMHALAVMGWEWGAIAILVGGNRLLSWEFERDVDAIAALVEAEAAFMRSVAAGTPPEPDARAADVLAGVYASAGGDKLTVTDPRVQDIGRETLSLRERVKTLDDTLEIHKNALKLYMRDSEILTMPGVGEFTWKKTKDKPVKVFNESAFKEAHPDLHAQFTERTTKPGHRTFRMKGEKDTDTE